MYRSAIIGCGRIFPFHADNLKNCPDTELACVCDIVEEKAKAAAEKYGCDYCTDYHDLLGREDIDAIHICTPHYLHDSMAIDALEAGKHVFLEKPVSITVERAQRLSDAAKKSGKKIAVCFQNRYNFSNRTVKELLDSGRLGKPLASRIMLTWERSADYYLSDAWRGTWDMEGGGLLINQAIHTVDLMQWLLGEPVWLKGSIDTRLLKGVIEVEDIAEATIRTNKGVLVNFFGSNCYLGNDSPFIDIICENAKLRLEGNIRIQWNDGREEIIEDADKGQVQELFAYYGLGHKRIISDFYAHLDDGKPFWINVDEAMKAITIVTGIYQSSRTGEAVTF